jgi:predicted neutral ceramidase superfamily lipid hydrolase
MMKNSEKTAVALPESNPTQQTTDVVIGDKVYRMCLNVRSLAQAERELNRMGYKVILLRGLASLQLLELDTILVLFAASIRKFHPDISFDDAIDMVTLPYVMPVAEALIDAWNKCLPAQETDVAGNPTEAGDGQAPTPVSEAQGEITD